MLATLGTVLAEIGWNPEIRNILAVSVGVVVLIGSVFLLVGSNAGLRTGALVTLAGLLGWMTTMGAIWWIYGIGLTGRAATWHVEELNYSVDGYADLAEAENGEARHLAALDEIPTAAELLEEDPAIADDIIPADVTDPDVRAARAANISLGQILEVRPDILDEYDPEQTLEGWRILVQSDPIRGDAVAVSDAFLGPDARGLFATSSQYLVRDVFVIGGRVPDADANLLEQAWNKIKHTVNPLIPEQHAVVQVQAVVPPCAEGEEPEPGVCQTTDPNAGAQTPDLVEDAPIISVVMIRDLGTLRFPAVMTTLICGLLFAATVWTLHRRDKVIAAVRAS